MDSQNLTFVLGGAKSGKSAFAESLYSEEDAICYVATGVMQHPDEEMKLRIKKHQARRPAFWMTKEQFNGLADLVTLQHMEGYLIDDLTMMVTNLFYQSLSEKVEPAEIDSYLDSLSIDQMNDFQQQILSEVSNLLTAQAHNQQSMVIVSDEVGLGVVPATKQTRVLRDIYGEANQLVAKAAQNVYFVVSGISQKLK